MDGSENEVARGKVWVRRKVIEGRTPLDRHDMDVPFHKKKLFLKRDRYILALVLVLVLVPLPLFIYSA